MFRQTVLSFVLGTDINTSTHAGLSRVARNERVRPVIEAPRVSATLLTATRSLPVIMHSVIAKFIGPQNSLVNRKMSV